MQGNLETRVGLFVLAAIGVFVYMGFQIGAFRFNRGNYNLYTMMVTDISGLSRKADVKIAGVKVGWVERINLIENDTIYAQADLMIHNKYVLYQDACVVVRQDGLLGTKYVDLTPGSSLLPELHSGDKLAKLGTKPVSIDEILHEFKKIAANVVVITDSFKEAVGGPDGQRQLQETFDNIHITMKQMASVSESLNRTLARNEHNIDAFLSIGNEIRRVSERLDSNVLPAFQHGIEKISTVFDRDFNRIASRLESTGQALEQASLQARDGLRRIGSVAQKIDEGEGLIGKLVNEDETYTDLRVAIKGFKNYLTKVDRLQIVFDSHFEGMSRPAEYYKYEDSKGYFDIRIHPNEDHFYLIELASSQKGFITQEESFFKYRDAQQQNVDVAEIDDLENYRLKKFSEEITRVKRNTISFGLQFGKIFKNIAVRFGMFENSAGAGVDVNIPFNTDKFRWTTSLEAFDMTGWNRINDRRPHLKWINRMFILRSVYMTFGADDFVSKRNASAFFGAGFRFGDDDVKYLLSSLSGGGMNFLQQR